MEQGRPDKAGNESANWQMQSGSGSDCGKVDRSLGGFGAKVVLKAKIELSLERGVENGQVGNCWKLSQHRSRQAFRLSSCQDKE